MAFSAFANFGDIKGECTDKDHKDWVAITQFGYQVTETASSIRQETGGGRTTDPAQHSGFEIVKLLDAATPKLYEAACKGTHIPEVVIECWGARRRPIKYFEVKLKEVLITGIVANGNPGGEQEFPTETVKMAYGAIEWTYTRQKPDGTAGDSVRVARP
jgi:type VI secretion system secreted protein Hcp